MTRRSLDSYKDKRDFRKTPEPSSGEGGGEEAIFVIQKHDASTLHYDFRIEVDGVLVSWAVPKGPSTDPSVKRLAIPTEDHPMGYADFEGVIPEGQYGAGKVLVWDRGEYRNIKRDEDGNSVAMSEGLEKGHLTIWLEGEKLQGGYALIRTDDERWLLVKMDDKEADGRRRPTSTEPYSVISGKSMDEIGEET